MRRWIQLLYFLWARSGTFGVAYEEAMAYYVHEKLHWFVTKLWQAIFFAKGMVICICLGSKYWWMYSGGRTEEGGSGFDFSRIVSEYARCCKYIYMFVCVYFLHDYIQVVKRERERET